MRLAMSQLPKVIRAHSGLRPAVSQPAMKYALRQILKNPRFSAIAMLTLALGIGVNTTTFSLVYAILYRMPPYPDLGRIVQIYGTGPEGPRLSQSPANIQDELKQFTVFEHATPFNYVTSNLAQPGEPAYRVSGLQVGGDFFTIIGMPPLLGRTLTPADDQPGKNGVVVVSERFWHEKLGGRADVIGTHLRLDAKPVTVVGVISGRADDIMTWGPVETWQPLGYDTWADRTNTWLGVIARLKPDTTLGAAKAQLSTIAGRLAHDFPEANAGFGLTALTYAQSRTDGERAMPWVIMGLMLSVLLIACVNLANLQLARTQSRLREFAVRIALGASRSQLIGHLLAESVLLSGFGGGFGLIIALWGNRLLGSQMRINGDTNGLNLPLSGPVLGFTFAAAVLTGVLFGLMPGLIAARTNVNQTLKQGGRGSSGDRTKHRMRQFLVVAELALALALLAGAGFFVRGIQRLQSRPSGWRTTELMTGHVVLPWNSYTTNEKMSATIERMETELASLPGVDHAAVSIDLPIFGFSGVSRFLVAGQPRPEKGQEPRLLSERISPDLLATTGIPLLAGRNFTGRDRDGAPPVMLINRAMAEALWPKGDAIGHRIGTLVDPKKPDWREIVGIVGDVKFVRHQGSGEPLFQTYHPVAQDPDHYLAFTLHGTGHMAAIAEAARLAINRVDPDLAVYDLMTVDQAIDQSDHNLVLVERLLEIAALLGLFLALIGIYGVVANLALQRTQEIGIRLAMGAQNSSILWLVLRNGLMLAATGTGIGLVLAFALIRGLSLAVPEIPGQDPLLVAILAVLLIVATLLACWLPAHRATRIDPIVALRDE